MACCPPLCQQRNPICHISKRRIESSREQEQLQATTRVAFKIAQQCGEHDSNKDSKTVGKESYHSQNAISSTATART